ncbi:hypothetical protein CIL03_08860 [Virgibacillus indicus]|uniref:Blue (type 1) copper domain-containing protein n=1 Tax=Virgibacillus indicus TaxID=2024554 RepID=A0A265NAP6_9BACI|nr:plastocyanin/azurin family copper-binding protein [Virgibacillus indicus]OZU89110.1 hypothetical protein CIL03_08860 [Virgibacillus indicus]
MGATLYLVFLITLLFSVIIVVKTAYNRTKIPCMTGMMIAMTLGMSVGLLLGVIFGILFTDDFFIATLLGMVTGMAVGFLAGVPVSIMAVLDGLLSGFMGGMMGAMLGAMIAVEYHETIVKIMFFLFLAMVLILIYMMQNEINGKKKSIYQNPLVPVALFGFLFFIFNQTGPLFLSSESAEHNHSKHNSKDNGLLIKANEYDFLPSDINIQVGETITMSIENTGTVEHDLEIIDFAPEGVQRKTSHNHGLSANTIHLHAEPGKKETISFTPVEKGIYKFVCTIPGHKESGMIGTLKVS